RPGAVGRGAREGERRLRDIGREYAGGRPRLGERHGERVRFLARRAARAPRSDAVVLSAAFPELGQHDAVDEGEMSRLAEEVRFADGELDDQVVEGVRVDLEKAA